MIQQSVSLAYIHRKLNQKYKYTPMFIATLFIIAKTCCCSVPKSYPTLCNPIDCNTSGFPVLHHLPEFAQIYVHWVCDAIQPSHPVTPFSSCPQSFPASASFPMNWLFTSVSQSIGTSASASVFPMNIQSWFPLGWTGLIPLQSKGSQESSPAPQFEASIL